MLAEPVTLTIVSSLRPAQYDYPHLILSKMMSVRNVVLMVADVVLLSFHISMVLFICCQRRKDKKLQSGFYAFYIAVSIADCCMTVNVRPLHASYLRVRVAANRLDLLA